MLEPPARAPADRRGPRPAAPTAPTSGPPVAGRAAAGAGGRRRRPALVRRRRRSAAWPSRPRSTVAAPPPPPATTAVRRPAVPAVRRRRRPVHRRPCAASTTTPTTTATPPTAARRRPTTLDGAALDDELSANLVPADDIDQFAVPRRRRRSTSFCDGELRARRSPRPRASPCASTSLDEAGDVARRGHEHRRRGRPPSRCREPSCSATTPPTLTGAGSRWVGDRPHRRALRLDALRRLVLTAGLRSGRPRDDRSRGPSTSGSRSPR